MRIDQDVKLDYKDVLIRPKRSTLKSRSEVALERSFNFRNYEPDFPYNGTEDPHYRGIPIMAANMDGVGTFEMADKLAEGEIFTCLVKTYTAEELIQYFYGDGLDRTDYVAMSIGTGESDYNKLCKVYEKCEDNLKYVCIDIANGYSEHFAQHVRKVRENFPHLVIIAGNVVTGEMTEELILAGADIVKVGIGPGSVCTTRIQTGVGYPQLSAVIECADAAHGLGGHIIADGGCTCPGDVAKAFAAGADFVMLGGMLAGHDEGGGEVITKYYETNELNYEMSQGTPGGFEKVIETKKFVQFYGMSSKSANDKHFGGLKDYRSSEGRTVLVPYRGSVADTVQEILGGVRSTCTYAGAKTLKQLSKCTTFVRCTQTHNGVYESTTIGK
jgi:GMP reductase